MKRALPWIVAAIFAIAFVAVLIGKRGETSNETGGVTQDNSGRRVIAWIDPMSVSTIVSRSFAGRPATKSGAVVTVAAVRVRLGAR